MDHQLKKRVSIVMRSKNSDWVIDRALAALYSQEYTDFELLVVDSGSTDRTLDIVREYPCKLVEIESKSYFPGAVLNWAIEQTAGEIIVFQNSDCVPLNQHALTHLVAAFDDPTVQAAFGRQIPRPEAEDWVRRDYAQSFPATGPAPDWITLSLPFAAMRRSAWLAHPFYRDAWASEDTEWGQWARREGHHVKYVPGATVMHSHNYTLKQIYGRRFVEGEADAFIYGGGDSVVEMLRRTAASTYHDLRHHAGEGNLRGAIQSPVRRMVYHWAYHRGRRFGDTRARSGSADVVTGQQAVLSRYE